MKTNKSNKDSEAVKNTESTNKAFKYTEKSILLAIESARLSGSALKSSTARNKGRYPIENKKNGTSIVLNFALKTTEEKEISGTKLISILEDTNFSIGIEERVKAVTNKEYKNYRTLVSRLKKEVTSGKIKSFYIA